MSRCDACALLHIPVEGMTGQCPICFGVYCGGHLGHDTHARLEAQGPRPAPSSADKEPSDG